MSVPSIPSSSTTKFPHALPGCDLPKQAVECHILYPESGKTRIIHVVYDPTITSFFEINLCTTCGAQSSDQNPYQPLIHNNCKREEIVVTIGDNISVQNSACFQGLPGKELNLIFNAALQKHAQCIEYIYSHLLPQLHKVLCPKTFS